MIPTLPPLAESDLAVAKSARRMVLYAGFEDVDRLPGACTNCNGREFILLRFVTGGPYSYHPGRDVAATYFESCWYTFETKAYACPMCGDPSARTAILFERSGLEPDERDWRFDFYAGKGKDFPLSQVYQFLAQVPRPTGWLLFHGDYGMGKSGMMKCVVAACIRAGVPAEYVRASDILLDIRATYGDDVKESERAVVRRFGWTQVLAVDEVDRVSSTPWAQSTLMAILDNRYNKRSRVATLIGTNADPENMPKGFEYLQSRMMDGDRVLIAGDPLRG